MSRPRFAPLILALFLITPGARAAWIDDPAPAFTLKDLEGKDVSLEDQKGKVVLVNFWASWCPPCKDEFPKLNELAVAYGDKDVAVIAVTLDKALANVHKFLDKYATDPVRLTLVRDPSAEAASRYGARAMPISFVVDRGGVIRYVHMGFQKDDETKWRKEIDVLLAQPVK